MKMFSRPIAVAAIAGLGLLASCKGGEPVNLKLNLQPGSQYLYAIENKMVMDMSVMGQSMKTNQNMTTECTYDVAAGEGTNKRITVTYDRIAMETKNPMLNMAYDSRDTAKSDKELRQMGGMLHKPFTMDVSEQGEILSVNGLNNLINSMSDTSSPEGQAIRQQLTSTFNDSAIKSMMQQALNIFPDHPVKPGDTWKKTFNMGTGAINLAIDNDFKLVSVSNGIAHIDVTSKIIGSGGAGPEMKNMNMDLNGDQKGTMEVEVATGLVKDGKMKQTIKGEMSVATMKVPVAITSDIHITGKKK